MRLRPLVCTAAATLTYAAVVRPWIGRWGATAAEAGKPLPGDDLVPEPSFTATRAITIAAPPQAVWPWLAQLGQGRGGFYSYAWLENLVGCRMRNADRIHSEWQSLVPGDEVRMHPQAPPLVVRSVRPLAVLVLGEPGIFSWAFVLQPDDGRHTRLLVRSRGTFGLPRLLGYLLEPGHFAMERRMLLGIRERAEP